jgi:hypothetical protein
MKYNEYEVAFSPARLSRYRAACGGNTRKAMTLYRYNMKLCQKYYAILNIFEIILRNAIDRHFRTYFNDSNWIVHQLQTGGMLAYSPKRSEALKYIGDLTKKGKLTPDKVVSAQSFGFWTYLFNKIPFNAGGKKILDIFPNKQLGLGQKAVYNELQDIKQFRNRIAHHEPICFDVLGNRNMAYVQQNYNQILKYISFLGYSNKQLLYGYDVQTEELVNKIMSL